jgi:ACS family tartrate transporter-like MFS transporter
VALRLLPFLFLLYVVNIVDRMNVGFAKLRMLHDLGLDEKVYGLGAGMFYVGYMAFEVPSNLILYRVGARRWISRIMVSWGIISACTMFVRDERSFYLLRMSLGLAEAGFFPGIILYMSYWFPANERARAVAWFMMASPLSGVVNGPISGVLLEYTNQSWGLAGWQWLFLLEGMPAVILGFVTWRFLTDRPEDASWLEPDERAWLSRRMDREEEGREARHGLSRLQALGNPRVGLLILLYFTIAVGTNGYGFFAPTIISTHFPDRGADQIGLLYAIPSLVAAAGMFLFSRHSDRDGERRRHLASAAVVAAIGWTTSATVQSPWIVLLGLTLAFLGMMCMMGPYWSLATSFLSGTAAAGGIALINTIANTGGVLAPYLMGWLKAVTGSFAAGQVMLGLTLAFPGSPRRLRLRDVISAARPDGHFSDLRGFSSKRGGSSKRSSPLNGAPIISMYLASCSSVSNSRSRFLLASWCFFISA